jgi:isocitrate dehydrogenase
LESGVRTGDFGDKSTTASNTTEFANAIIANFGKMPQHGAKTVTPNKPITPTQFILDKNPLIISKEMGEEQIVGADLFVESAEQPLEVATKCLRHVGTQFKVSTISNRGTQVWPTGSVFTNVVNQYRVRFESIDDKALAQSDIIALYERMSQDFKVCSTELLNMWNGKKAYSLAQGQ